MRSKVGIGIIGTGFARKVQIPAFRTCADSFIASIASGSLENARSAADEFGIGHFTDDWRETVSHPDVQLVCITTPPRLHREMTLYSIENGKHILCEKPMAMDLAEANEMAEAAGRFDGLALIDHELRFQPGRQMAYQMLRDGKIGKIRHAKALFRAPHRGDPKIKWNWWSDDREGGGALGAIASHVIDSFNWLLGTEISAVSCQLQTHIKQRSDEKGEIKSVTSDDEANMLVRFGDGDLTSDATGIVSVSMTEYPGYQNSLEFYGTDGSLRLDHNGQVEIGMPDGSEWKAVETDLGSPVPGGPDTGFSRGFMALAPEIVSAIVLGRTSIEHAATFDDGVRVQRVLDAARSSDAEGRTVSLV